MEREYSEDLTLEEIEKLYNKIEEWEFVPRENSYKGKINDLEIEITRGFSTCGAGGIISIKSSFYDLILNYKGKRFYYQSSGEKFHRELEKKRKDKEEEIRMETEMKMKETQEELSQKGINYTKELLKSRSKK